MLVASARPVSLYEIEERRDAPIAVLHCSGQLAAANADRFKSAVTRLLDGKIFQLVIDLAQVSFLDSAGIGGLVAAMTLRLVYLDKALAIFPTEEDARSTLL